MKQLLILMTGMLMLSSSLRSQELPFGTAIYYYRLPNDSLYPSGLSLTQFNYNSASSEHAIFHDGIFFETHDCFNRNLWVRVRHVAADPNGTSAGANVPATYSNPCQSSIMIGGWFGFLYDFEIYRDVNLTGERGYFLDELFPTSITVASLEWLSGTCGSSEWIGFEILNSESSGWSLNSVNFTGVNPGSHPAYSEDMAVYTTGGCYPPDGFTYTFPEGSPTLSFINGSSSGYTELKMSAAGVSHFQYGYEYGSPGGYQGMSMAFGSSPTFSVSAQPVTCRNGNDGSIDVTVTGGIGPFTYEWVNEEGETGTDIIDLYSGEYQLTIHDLNGCVATSETFVVIVEPSGVTVNVDTVEVADASCYGASDGSITVVADGASELIYEWSNGETSSEANNLSEGAYWVIVSDENSCWLVEADVNQPDQIDASVSVSGTLLTANLSGANYQWLDCNNGNSPINDAIAQGFNATQSGSYAVEIEVDGCINVSECIQITIASIEGFDNETAMNVYPNPVGENLSLSFSESVHPQKITLTDVTGRTLNSFKPVVTNTVQSVDFNLYETGIYLLVVELENGQKLSRTIVKD
jgi:hypothetical protein